MKEYLFFLSYAREDRENDQENLILDFHEKLVEALNHRGATEGGFLDTWSTSTADLWTVEADEALRNCKVFVPIYSPNFFTREYCGQEWAVFERRVKTYQETKGGKDAPSLIMPVLFVRKAYLEESFARLGPSVSDIVFHHRKDPEEYIESGLEVFKLNKFQDSYKQFVMGFADRLVELSKKHPLPQVPGLASVATVQSAFHAKKPTKAVARLAQSKKVPDYVEFLLVVGTREEMLKVRKHVQGYGEGWLDWAPYEPDERIGLRAQKIASREGFVSGIVGLQQNLTQWLSETKKQNRIAAIIVDSWALSADTYANLVSDYDSYDSLHSLMLVCVNSCDKETQRKFQKISKVVETVFETKSLRGVHSNFLFPVNSSAEFEGKLVASLGKIRMELLNRELDQLKHKRAAESRPETKAAGANPSMPSLPVPGS